MSEAILDKVNTYSSPTDLRITDMRIANLARLPFEASIIRLDTNQGISGYGEVRDWASPTYALMLKRQLIGENPCNVDKLFRKVKQFGHHARQAGGVCGVDMALMDLAGKAYGVPAYMLAGGKFRDKILCYCDTPSSNDPQEMVKNIRSRLEKGFQFLKMDVGIDLISHLPDTLSAPFGMIESTAVMHPFTGIQITEKGIEHLVAYVATVREAVGYSVPLAADHFGHIGLESCIRLGRALDKFNLAWYEDMLPWQFTNQYLRLSESVTTPTCTGEDIFLKENFRPLLEARAVSIIHPDIASSGGILETKKIGDMAQDYGVAMAMHMAGSPVSTMAAVHCAAATENFLALEHHSADIPHWDDLFLGLPSPLIQDGFIRVPETPGLGFTDINEEVFAMFLNDERPLNFQSTEAWDKDWSHDRLWS